MRGNEWLQAKETRVYKDSQSYVVHRINSEPFKQALDLLGVSMGQEIGRAFENGQRSLTLKPVESETITISMEEYKSLQEMAWKYKELCK